MPYIGKVKFVKINLSWRGGGKGKKKIKLMSEFWSTLKIGGNIKRTK